MTIALFVIAGVMLVFVAVVAPSVIKTHRAWKAWRKFVAEFPDLETQFQTLTNAIAGIGITAAGVAESMKVFADALNVEFSVPSPERGE